MIIDRGRPKQKNTESAKRPYQPDLGGFAAAEYYGRYYGRKLPSVDVTKADDIALSKRTTDKPIAKPELGGFAAAEYHGRRLPSVSVESDTSREPEFE